MSLFHALSPSPSFPPQEIWPSAKLLRETNCLSPIHHQEQEGQNKSQASASRQQQQIDDVPYILPSLSYSIEKLLLQSWFDISNRSSFSTWKQRQTGAWWILLSFLWKSRTYFAYLPADQWVASRNMGSKNPLFKLPRKMEGIPMFFSSTRGKAVKRAAEGTEFNEPRLILSLQFLWVGWVVRAGDRRSRS